MSGHISLSDGLTLELNQLRLNDSCEPVVVEKCSHSETHLNTGFE